MTFKSLALLSGLAAIAAAAPFTGQHQAFPLAKATDEICLKFIIPVEAPCPEGTHDKIFPGTEIKTCCFGTNDQHSNRLSAASQADICLLVCFPPEQKECPPGWTHKVFGECGTCCRDTEHGYDISTKKVANKKTAPSALDLASQDICLLVCWPEEPHCPEGWSSKQFGECYTCCRNTDQGNYSIKKISHDDHLPAALQAAVAADVCLKVCWPEEPQCPEGWNSKKFGDDSYPCYTCCKTYEDYSASTKMIVKNLSQKTIGHVDTLSAAPARCLLLPPQLCVPWQELTCPDGMLKRETRPGCVTCCVPDETEPWAAVTHEDAVAAESCWPLWPGGPCILTHQDVAASESCWPLWPGGPCVLTHKDTAASDSCFPLWPGGPCVLTRKDAPAPGSCWPIWPGGPCLLNHKGTAAPESCWPVPFPPFCVFKDKDTAGAAYKLIDL